MENLVDSYNAFQNNYGQSVSADYKTIVENLFISQFKKIANGQTLAAKRDDLLKQLSEVKEFSGTWFIEPKLILPAKDNRYCTFRYILNSTKAGKFDIIAVMYSSDGIKIDWIDEVYYKISN